LSLVKQRKKKIKTINLGAKNEKSMCTLLKRNSLHSLSYPEKKSSKVEDSIVNPSSGEKPIKKKSKFWYFNIYRNFFDEEKGEFR